MRAVSILRAFDDWALNHPNWYGIASFTFYLLVAFLVAPRLRLNILIIMPSILAIGQTIFLYARRHGRSQ